MTQPPTRPSLREQVFVLLSALAFSLLAIGFSWSRNAFLYYGDAEAHMHIARRLFDSHRPGLGQLGSVWLPLPHLLLAPFVAIDSWWRSGFAPVLPSALCYLLACLGLYRLARLWLTPLAASVALLFFLLNPNLLYLQTTAMTEPLFLCELVWTILLLAEWHAGLDQGPASRRRLWVLAAVLIAAVFTRYDGWILAFLAWLAIALCLYRRGRLLSRGFVFPSVALLLAPVSWMAYNAILFGDWLDFLRGPYSARAIELRTAANAFPPHPGWHNPFTSAIFFVKAAEMDAAAASFGNLLLILATAGWLILCLRYRLASRTPAPSARSGPSAPTPLWTLLLWLPLPFYAYSVSYGSVPIFLPVWWPHSWYNTRYGMELLPAFAFSLACAWQWLLDTLPPARRLLRPTLTALLFAAILGNALEMIHEGPLTYVEALKNTQARGYYNHAIAAALAHLHQLSPQASVLMDTSGFPSIVPLAGLTYRQTINESDKQYFQAALADPASHTPIVLGFSGDQVDRAIQADLHAHPGSYIPYRTFSAKDQQNATLYVRRGFPGIAQSSPAPEASSQPSSASPPR
jgi:hypothetical protein